MGRLVGMVMARMGMSFEGDQAGVVEAERRLKNFL
jgi:hypothetical protein